MSNKNRLAAQHIEALLHHPVAAMVSMIMTGDTSSLMAAATSLPSPHLTPQESGGDEVHVTEDATSSGSGARATSSPWAALAAGRIEVMILQSVMQHVSWPPPPESSFLSGFDGSEVCMFTVSWLEACADVLLSGNAGKDVQGGCKEVDRDIQARIALGVLRKLFDFSNARLNHVSYMGLDEMLQFASLEHQYGVGKTGGTYGTTKEESEGEVRNGIISLCERIIAAHPSSPAVLVQDRKGDLPLHIL